MLFDLIVIGSGPAGQRAALQAAKLGKKVAIIEACPLLGGACVHAGTLPSKSFRESVYRWSMSSKGSLGRVGDTLETPAEAAAAHGEATGAKPTGRLPDMARLLKRRDRVITGEAGVVEAQLKRNGVAIYYGHGRLTSANDVEVTSNRGKEKLTATIVIIATGARPVAPAHLAVDGVRVHDSDTILNLRKVPKTLVVLGAGIIGCEYASMFATAGSRVLLIDRRHEILAAVDREVVATLMERFKAQGMEIMLEAEARKIEKKGAHSVKVGLSNDREIVADAVLISQGRFGNTDGLGLEEAGVERDNRGLIQVDAHYRTTVPNIYAVGDVVGPPALASTSMEEGRLASRHAFNVDEGRLPALFPYGIYTIPEISMLGPTEEDLIAKKADFVVGRAKYREVARGQIVGDRWGLLKLLVDRSTLKLLGVHIIGDSAAELIHIGQAVMAFGGDVNYFIHNVFNYPTLAEAYKNAAFHAVNRVKAAARPE